MSDDRDSGQAYGVTGCYVAGTSFPAPPRIAEAGPAPLTRPYMSGFARSTEDTLVAGKVASAQRKTLCYSRQVTRRMGTQLWGTQAPHPISKLIIYTPTGLLLGGRLLLAASSAATARRQRCGLHPGSHAAKAQHCRIHK